MVTVENGYGQEIKLAFINKIMQISTNYDLTTKGKNGLKVFEKNFTV